MMNNPEYAEKAIAKMEAYEKNGICPGKGLMVTFESRRRIINKKALDTLMESYLL